MTLSTSRLAYLDCFDFFQKAQDDERGIRIRLDSREAATRFRHRLHYARKLDRKDNLVLYEEGHKMHGRSLFDTLEITISTEDDVVWVYIKQIRAEDYQVESLSTPSEAVRRM